MCFVVRNYQYTKTPEFDPYTEHLSFRSQFTHALARTFNIHDRNSLIGWMTANTAPPPPEMTHRLAARQRWRRACGGC